MQLQSRACFTIESACDCNATRIALQLCLYTGVRVDYKCRFDLFKLIYNLKFHTLVTNKILILFSDSKNLLFIIINYDL